MRNVRSDLARLPLMSQTAEHALRAVLYLARHRGDVARAQELECTPENGQLTPPDLG